MTFGSMKSRIGRPITGVGMALLVALLATGAVAQERKTITVTGSSTIAPILLEAGRAYEQRTPGVRIDVQTGGSSRGIADARNGRADIGMASRAPKADEGDLKWTLVANDGLAIIVHKDNPVAALAADHIRALYRGEITDWSAVGGKAGPVTLVHKAEGRSTLELFLHFFGLKNPDVKPHAVVGDNLQGVQTVAANPTAIGYVSIGTAETSVSDGVPIRLLPYGGVAASVANVANGTYPLLRPLNLVTKEPVPAHVAAFLAFAASSDADRFITEQAFVPPPR